ncbi:hypothetical protein Tco_0072927 [Tanacetum coccineum]
MSRRYGYMFRHMKKSFMPRKDMNTIAKTVEETLKVVVPKMANETTDQNMRDSLHMIVTEGIRLEREKTKANIALMVADVVRKENKRTRAELSLQVSNDVATNMKDDKQARDANFPLWLALMYTFEKPASHVDPCRVDAFRRLDHEDHHDDDARPEGESSAKRQRMSKKSTYTRGESSSQTMEESTPSGSGTQEQQDFDARKGMKWVLTVDDQKRMQDALNDMMRSRCDSREEHQYHLDQMKSYMESQIVWESREEDLTLHIPKKPTLIFQSYERDPNAPPIVLVNKDLFYLKIGNSETRKYVLSLNKIHVFLFLENDLEELNTG